MPSRASCPNRFTALALLAAVLTVAAPAASPAPESGQSFKDWSARCETPNDATREKCFIFQRLVTRQGEEYLPILHVLVGYITADGNPGLFATVPLGVSLPQGLELRVDDGEPVSFGYSHCNNQGCLGALALSDELIAKMKAGNQAVITFHAGAEQPVSVSVSLQGFTAGFDALE